MIEIRLEKIRFFTPVNCHHRNFHLIFLNAKARKLVAHYVKDTEAVNIESKRASDDYRIYFSPQIEFPNEWFENHVFGNTFQDRDTVVFEFITSIFGGLEIDKTTELERRSKQFYIFENVRIERCSRSCYHHSFRF